MSIQLHTLNGAGLAMMLGASWLISTQFGTIYTDALKIAGIFVLMAVGTFFMLGNHAQ